MNNRSHLTKNRFVSESSSIITCIRINHPISRSATKYIYVLNSVYFPVLVNSKTTFMISWKSRHGGQVSNLKKFC